MGTLVQCQSVQLRAHAEFFVGSITASFASSSCQKKSSPLRCSTLFTVVRCLITGDVRAVSCPHDERGNARRPGVFDGDNLPKAARHLMRLVAVRQWRTSYDRHRLASNPSTGPDGGRAPCLSTHSFVSESPVPGVCTCGDKCALCALLSREPLFRPCQFFAQE